MRIAVVSDSHGNLANMEKVFGWVEKENIKVILHCGDIGDAETLKESLKNYSGKFFGVLGNMDEDFQKDIADYQQDGKIIVYPEIGEAEFDGKRIAFAHEPEPARGLAGSGRYDLVFYGHTHKPWEEKVADCRLINPGNIANQIFRPTFAVYDTETDKLELKILERL